jgi:predicted metal-dependent HD superfamily phosphohydrolase
MDFLKLKEKITRQLELKIDERFFYHKVEHTLMVIESARKIGSIEKLGSRELELVLIAALFHDTGFLVSREEHERHSCDILKAELSGSDFSEDEIKRLCGMIMATQIPQSPKNKLERILADADLHYLGTDEYDEYADLLYRELKTFNPSFSDDEWLDLQISFLESHSFHTDFGKRQLEPKKKQNLATLKSKRAS